MSCIILEEEDESKFIIISGTYRYNLNEPDKSYFLPGHLQEISGLSYWKESILLCVEDENGYLYLFDHKREEVINELKFGKKGDYEGVAQYNDVAYVIRSDGQLYFFEIKEEPEVTKIKLPFTSKNDLEGLTVGHKKDELYIACKRSPDIFERDLKGRAVYQYNVKKDKVDTNPYILLTSETFEIELKKAGLKPSNHMPFQPSGIAIHPFTEDVFLLSSVGKLLLVLNKSGKIVSMVPLKRSLFRQPEGICFDGFGNMFISSEGRGQRGYILNFGNQPADQ
jgi:uncharacterized protein YjiK